MLWRQHLRDQDSVLWESAMMLQMYLIALAMAGSASVSQNLEVASYC
jgi:hypothetical protein